MKNDIHPGYEKTTISCACGNEIATRSTAKDLRVEICSKCHPFYTGVQKLVDTAGRIERFRKKYGFEQEAPAEEVEETEETEEAVAEETPAS